MSSSNDPISHFTRIVNEYKMWNSFEIKACLFREDTSIQWKIGFLYIQLRHNTPYTVKGINTDHVKLIHVTRDIRFLADLLKTISSRNKIKVSAEIASLELLTGDILFDYHQRINSNDLYDVDCFCYELIKGGKQPEGYSALLRHLDSILRQNDPPYENLRDACKAILGIDFGTSAYYPFCSVVAPVLVNIDRVQFTENKIVVELNCLPKVEVNDLKITLFEKDDYGKATKLRKNVSLIRKDGTSKAYGIVSLTNPDTASRFLKVILYYKNQEIEDMNTTKSRSNTVTQYSNSKILTGVKEYDNKHSAFGISIRNLDVNVFKYDFAISFAGEDRSIAEKLYNLLKNSCEVFMRDVEHHLLGAEIDEILKKVFGPLSRYVIVLVSRHYPKKDWTDFEFQIAKSEWNKRKRDFILPIRLDDTNFPGLRSSWGYLYLNHHSIEDVTTILLRKLREKPNWS